MSQLNKTLRYNSKVLRNYRRNFATTNLSFSANEKLGFIGLGQMGHHMANNLYRNSRKEIVVYDINSQAIKHFLKSNKDSKVPIHVASSLREIGQECNLIITMLPESSHVKSAYLDDNGILSGIKPGTICIDSSTIDPKTSIYVTEKVSEVNGIGLDAPVSGGIMGAEAGTLTFMVGSPKLEYVNKIEPILSHMGKSVIHCGDLGTGLIAKICNNLLLAVTMVGACEALHLGTKLGMDPKLLCSIMDKSSGRSWTIDTANPIPGYLPNSPSSKDYEGGFAIKLMLKDVSLAIQAAKDTKSSVMTSALVEQIYRHVSNYEEFSKKDFSVLYKWLSENK